MSKQKELLDVEILDTFLGAHPDLERLEIMIPDLNGTMRGKWLPASSIPKILQGAARIPLATYCADIWGNDVEAAGVAGPLGDPDGKMMPDLATLALVPWAKGRAAQVVASIYTDENELSPYDPRELVKRQVERLSLRGLKPVAAVELEFHLFRQRINADEELKAPARTDNNSVFNLENMTEVEACLLDIQSAAKIQNLPVDTLIAEYGSGQFEINLEHTENILQACDQAMLLKRLVRSVARNHQLEASFMAKPYGNDVGSGMHVHISLLDNMGLNVFTDKNDINDTLKHAIGGLMASMKDFQLCYSPNQNSFRRLASSYFEASQITWGEDNRNLSIRVPDHKSLKGARLEHRVSGADANPYLVVASILAGIDFGLEHKCDPGEAFRIGDTRTFNELHLDWRPAIRDFEQSEIVTQYFGKDLQSLFAITKLSEVETFNAHMSKFELQTYSRGI